MQRIISLFLSLMCAFLMASIADSESLSGAAVGKDAVAVVEGTKLKLLSTHSNEIMWMADIAQDALEENTNISEIGDRWIVLTNGVRIFIFDRMEIEKKPQEWNGTPPYLISQIPGIYVRAVPILVKGPTIWGKAETILAPGNKTNSSAIFAFRILPGIGNSVLWAGGIMESSLVESGGVIYSPNNTEVRLYNANNGAHLGFISAGMNAAATPELVPMTTNNGSVFIGTKRGDQVICYGAVPPDDIRSPDTRNPLRQLWQWEAENDIIDIRNDHTRNQLIVSIATPQPYATRQKPDEPSSASLVALDEKSGRVVWEQIIVPGDARGMYIPLNDLTVSGDTIYAITKRVLDVELERSYQANLDAYEYYLYSYASGDGKQKWKFKIDGLMRIYGVSGRTIMLETDTERFESTKRWAERQEKMGKPRMNLPDFKVKVQAIDLASGKLLWERVDAHIITFTNELVYIQDKDDAIVAIDGQSGEVCYSYIN